MASNESGQAANRAPATAATISAGITVNGNVSCTGDLQISGRIEGEVKGATIVIDQGGVVDGAVHAERLRVSGTVTGMIKVGDLAIEPGGHVSGDTSYGRLKVASGGIVEGTFAHHGTKQATPAGESEAPLKLVSAPVNPRHVFVD